MFKKLVITTLLLITLSRSHTCWFETSHDAAYFGLPMVAVLIPDYFSRKYKVNKFSRVTNAIAISAIIILSQKNNHIRRRSVAFGAFLSVAVVIEID